eukprot:CAMPEP_0170525804 /NCGR_PEP_ID=MMETSP0209-20121228/11244_1 /TAXON_ID=665100 ORGANISM="Litonotus pictus, Strain P1" /NCGR_SAMPLE_ID=MMETSP0209 /ASSEMBLY_ACC=CAM_ASM_000301 /LENGTH=232 /DNA_ID=CAMNT_0010815257 /DNA_START=111 /DNA_END=809 /DNA_ORIENTATION=+
MNNTQNISLLEPFTRFRINQDIEKKENYPFQKKEDFIKYIESKITQAENKDKFLLIKEITDNPKEHFQDIVYKIAETRPVKFVYMARHPKAAYSSYHRKLKTEIEAKEEIIEAKKAIPMYQPLWDMYEKHKGKIVITEDLQEEPNRVIKELYEYIGMEFKEEYLKFKPLEEEGIPEDWKFLDLKWYDVALTSTEIKPGKTDLSKIEIDDEKIIEVVRTETPYYEKLVEESKK